MEEYDRGLTFQEMVFFSTVRITVKGDVGRGASQGTGFLLVIENEVGKGVLTLVSNKHVFEGASRPLILTFHKKIASPGTAQDLGPTFTIEEDFSGAFIEHPNPNVDLACVGVSGLIKNRNDVFFSFLDEQLLTGFDERQLIVGSEVFFVGYPEGLFDTKHNLPILRKGSIATLPSVDFEGKKQFLIDAQVFPGSSGSPVFISIDGVPQLVGVVAESVIRHGHLVSIPSTTSIKTEEFIGLGIVLKTSLLRELIDHARNRLFP